MKIPIEKLKEYRQRGMKPECVMITLYPAKQPQWWRESRPVIDIVADQGWQRADFRPLVGCHVIVMAEAMNDVTRGVSEKVMEYAQSLAVLSPIDVDSFDGFAWQRGKGWRKFGDEHG